MVEILAIENGDDGGFFPEERLRHPTDIMVVCSSLISCSTVNDDDDDSGSDIDGIGEGRNIQVQLAHFSVKEYLLSDRCAMRSEFQTQTCSIAIAEGCLRYLLHLCEGAPLNQGIVDQHPLSRYAAEHWWQHAQEIGDTHDCAVFDLASRLLTNKRTTLLSCIQLYDVDRPWRGIGLSLEMNELAQPLYYAACFGVPEVVEEILQQSIDVNAQGGYWGNALQAASVRGDVTVVQVLLDAGAEVNAQGGGYWGNALQAASVRGGVTVVQVLLDAGAEVNAQGGGEYGNALQAASYRGDVTVVQVLLDAGAEVNAQGGGYWGNALQAASYCGHEAVVQVLLDAGAEVNAQGGYWGNALQAASVGGHGTVVQMLLDAGATVNESSDVSAST
jgi:ankyrin repeat protein